jgi:hypothetical protein
MLTVFSRPAVTQVNIAGDARTAQQRFGLDADHDELDTVCEER